MTVKDLQELYDYGSWANERLFEALSQVTSEEFTEQVDGTGTSVRNLFVHAVSAEWGWLSRCGGAARSARLESNDYPTVESVIEISRKVKTWVREFLSKLKDEDLDRQIEFKIESDESRSLSLGSIMQHGANHSVHHRGQISLLLRMLGKPPGDTDILIYFALKNSS